MATLLELRAIFLAILVATVGAKPIQSDNNSGILLNSPVNGTGISAKQINREGKYLMLFPVVLLSVPIGMCIWRLMGSHGLRSVPTTDTDAPVYSEQVIKRKRRFAGILIPDPVNVNKAAYTNSDFGLLIQVWDSKRDALLLRLMGLSDLGNKLGLLSEERNMINNAILNKHE